MGPRPLSCTHRSPPQTSSPTSEPRAVTATTRHALTHPPGRPPQVAAEVDPKLLAEMEEMGFPRNRAVRAIWHSKATTTIEAAVNWCVEHEADMDIDEPLMVSKVRRGCARLARGGDGWGWEVAFAQQQSTAAARLAPSSEQQQQQQLQRLPARAILLGLFAALP